MAVTVVCKTCKKEFSVRPYQVETRSWCSTPCKNLAHRVAKTCQYCSKDFWIYASQERKGLGQFCGKSCKDLSRTHPKKPKVERETLVKVCETCDSTFQISPSREESAKFCSIECKFASSSFIESIRAPQLGEKSSRWSGGKYLHKHGYVAQKSTVLGSKKFRYEHQNVMLAWMEEEVPNHVFLLEIEGGKKLAPGIVIHHIDRDRTNNTRDNLLAVARDAHYRIHNQGKKPEPWECWPSHPTKW